MDPLIDQLVQTPIGIGRVESTWQPTYTRDRKALVLMDMTEAVQAHLDEPNCMSRGTDAFALFWFYAGDLSLV